MHQLTKWTHSTVDRSKHKNCKRQHKIENSLKITFFKQKQVWRRKKREHIKTIPFPSIRTCTNSFFFYHSVYFHLIKIQWKRLSHRADSTLARIFLLGTLASLLLVEKRLPIVHMCKCRVHNASNWRICPLIYEHRTSPMLIVCGVYRFNEMAITFTGYFKSDSNMQKR